MTIIVVLISLVVVLTSCSGRTPAPASSPVPTSITPTPTQTTGIPSQGGPVSSPATLPQGSAPGVPAPGPGVPSQVIPAPAPGVPSIGTSSPGMASSGTAAPNVAVSAPAPNSFFNQPSFMQPISGQAQSTGIWVNGQGEVSATPDTASLTLGVDSQAATVAEAQNNASTSMDAVIRVLKNKGVADKDITTVGFNIYPTFNYKNNTITGYQVSNTIIAKIRKIEDTGSIIDGVTSAGGNLIRVSGISFSVDDPAPFLAQARQLAVADATAKASQLAAATGVKLGLPTFITENTSNYLPVPPYFAAAAAGAPAPTTPISPGVTQISVNVQIVYAIQ
jgi:uncharacterized protein YggE